MSAIAKEESTSPPTRKRCLNQTLYAEAKHEPGSPTNVRTEHPGATPPLKKLKTGALSRLAIELSSPSSARRRNKRPQPLDNSPKNAFGTEVLEKPDVHMGGPGPAATAPDAAFLGARGSAETAPAVAAPAVTAPPNRAARPTSDSKRKFNAFNQQVQYLKKDEQLHKYYEELKNSHGSTAAVVQRFRDEIAQCPRGRYEDSQYIKSIRKK